MNTTIFGVTSQPSRFFYWLERKVMMEFGFSSFLDKFEARFGGRFMTGLLILVGLSITSFCLNLIATYAIIPTISLIYSVVETDRFGSYQALKTIQVLLNIFFFVLLYAGFRAALEAHGDRAEAARIADEYAIFREFAIDFWDTTGEFNTNLSDALFDIEHAKTKSNRTDAVWRARSLVEESRQDYSRRVERFNASVSASNYRRRAKTLATDESTGDPSSLGLQQLDTGAEKQP